MDERTKAWMDFAKGGHKEADKKIQATYAERAADAERKRKDAEMERALFGSPEGVTDTVPELKGAQVPEEEEPHEPTGKMIKRESVWNPPVVPDKKEDVVEVVSLLD